MASGADTSFLAARFLYPDMLERGRANALSCPVYQSGALVAPTSGTVAVFDAAGTSVASSAVTIAGDIATYTLPSATTTDLSLGINWRVEWSLLIAGVDREFRNDAALVRNVLYPVLCDQDLFARQSSLDPSLPNCVHSLSTFQTMRDEAWIEIKNRLCSLENRPNLITTPSALRRVHLTLTLSYIYVDFSTRLNEAYLELGDRYRHEFERAWSSLRFGFDPGDDGKQSSTRRRAAITTVWTDGRW